MEACSRFRQQGSFQLLVAVKMILDGPFVPASHKNESINACGNGLFSCILNERLIDYR
jgi:hypothetical protein